MKKVIFGIILSVSFVGIVYSQSPRSNQIAINEVIFTLGVNKYENDYDLIFNRWYQRHTSAKDLKPGEPLDWVNNFTSKFNISTTNYDVTLDQNDIGKDFRCIQFKGASYNDSGNYIYLFYDNNGILVLVSIQSVWDYVKIFDGVKYSRPITVLDINKKIDIYATDLFQFFDNITYELKYNLVSTGRSAITEMNIGLVDNTIHAEFKKIVLWTADYQKKTGLSLDSKNNREKLIGFEFKDSSIRISHENDERLRIEQERRRLEQEQHRLDLEKEREERAKKEMEELQERETQAKLDQEKLEIDFINSVKELKNIKSILVNSGGRYYEIKIGDTTGGTILTAAFNNHDYGRYEFAQDKDKFQVKLNGQDLIVLNLDRMQRVTKITIMPNLALLNILTIQQDSVRLW